MVAVLSIGIAIALYSRKLKEERIIEGGSVTGLSNANQFNDSLKALKLQQEEEVAKLYKKIEELHQQLISYQKLK